MDRWRYFGITHARHDLLNPSSGETLDELGSVVGVRPTDRVLDIGCGHAELLLRWHTDFGCTGVGVDRSPYHAARARERVEQRGLGDRISIIEQDGGDYRSDESFDVAICLGASWIFGGHAGTLQALTKFAISGGVVIVGEPYWIDDPPEPYLQSSGLSREQFLTLDECREQAVQQGLELIWMIRSTSEQWDRYEMLQSSAVDAFAREHPDDPDLTELKQQRQKEDMEYTRWGNRYLGWAIWAFRAPTNSSSR